jgi:hypothetical protein
LEDGRMIRKFVVEERISQYPQIEFEFKGKTYQTAALSISLINRLGEIEKDAENNASPAALKSKMRMLIPGLTEKVCDELDIRIILDFIAYVTDFCTNPENCISEEMKKKINIGEPKPN